MNKKLYVILCMIILVVAMSTASVARKEGCSFCGGDIMCYDKSDERLAEVHVIQCGTTEETDIVRVYERDWYYACEDCGRDGYVDVVERAVLYCDNGGELGDYYHPWP